MRQRQIDKKARLPFVSVLLLLTLLLSGADTLPLVRLEIINKAPMPIGVRMTGQESEQFYYLQVRSASSNSEPTVQTFTIARDKYNTRVYFLESYDLVYGYRCSYSATTVDARHKVRLLVRPCGSQAALSGEKRRPNRGRPENLTPFEVKSDQ